MENKWDVIGIGLWWDWGAVEAVLVVMSRIMSRTRSSIRKRDSFQANRERVIVLCGNEVILSVRMVRMWDGL